MLETTKRRLGALRQRILPIARSASSRRQSERLEDFGRALEREIARAGRTDRCLSVVLFRVANRRRHPLSAHRLALYVCRRVRSTDSVGWMDDENLGVILPDTPASGASRFGDSVAAIIATHMPRPSFVVHGYPCAAAEGNCEHCTLCAANRRNSQGSLAWMRQTRHSR